jgi:SAM-dependent methyltransferase
LLKAERKGRNQEGWDLEVLRDAVRYQQWILSGFRPHLRGDILEVGAGNGNFTRWLAQSADRVLALEPDGVAYRQLVNLRLPGVEPVQAPLKALDGDTRRFDCVVMINVLEHIPDDDLALRTTHDLLAPGGNLCVFVPAHPVLYAEKDRRLGHVRRYTKPELKSKVEMAGFAVRQCRYFNPLGALGWLILMKWLKRMEIDPASIWITERVAVPVGKALEGLGLVPFGQSALAVGEKRNAEAET